MTDPGCSLDVHDVAYGSRTQDLVRQEGGVEHGETNWDTSFRWEEVWGVEMGCTLNLQN